MADEPSLPKRIAVVGIPFASGMDADGVDGTTSAPAAGGVDGRRTGKTAGGAAGETPAYSYILDDFVDAFSFYARVNAQYQDDIPKLERFELDEGTALNGFDTVVFATFLQEHAEQGTHDGLAHEMADRWKSALQKLQPQTRVYLIVAQESSDPNVAVPLLASVGQVCAELGLAWCGGMIVPKAVKRAKYAHAPRMGWRRRKLSEASDRLILAIRCGAEAGVIEA